MLSTKILNSTVILAGFPAMEWCLSRQLERICNFSPLPLASFSLLCPLRFPVSPCPPFPSSKSLLFRTCLAAAHVHSHSGSSPTLQLRLSTALLPRATHWARAAKVDRSLSVMRNRGSKFLECHKDNRSRMSAVSSGDDRQDIILDTTDAGRSQRDTEKIPLLTWPPSSQRLTLPTILTLGRVAAIPVLFFSFYSNDWWATAVVACIFVLAAITDWLDGFLARKMRTHSEFGAFLDPVADKLMVATALVLLCTKPLQLSWAAAFPWLIPLPATLIIGREITMSAVREWAASQGGDLQAAVAVNRLGKWKTASQMVALTVLLATRDCSQNDVASLLTAVGVGSLYISAGLALWSLAVYMKGIWGALMK